MLSRRNRRPTSAALLRVWECLDADDVPRALAHLREGHEGAASLPLDEVALVVARAAGLAGFDDLREAATELSAHPGQGQRLHDFGSACVARGLAHLAVPALREALRQRPGALPVVRALAAAYEARGRHREAVELLTRHEDGLADWPDRFSLAFHAVMAGDLALASRQHALLTDPEDARWLPARDQQRRLLDRAGAAGSVGALDLADLRGWQFVIGGTVLTTLSPYGFDAGMTGRYAWLQDTHGQCLRGLLRLRALLDATGTVPRSVSLLPDRGSEILGLAAADVLGLAALPFEPGREDTVVVAYDLGELAEASGGPEGDRGAACASAGPGPARARQQLDRSARRHRRQRHAAAPGGHRPLGRASAPGGRRRGALD
ncbi:hypothetical protein RB200_22275 [Streptomyces sp. PmtG]